MSGEPAIQLIDNVESIVASVARHMKSKARRASGGVSNDGAPAARRPTTSIIPIDEAVARATKIARNYSELMRRLE